VPLHLDVPEIALIWLDEPDPHAPMGARGIGEIGITGVGAAVVHAVATPPANVSAIFPSLLNKLF
jgi:xanthine dehydrogenase YagR molybdenum-binding subunit